MVTKVESFKKNDKRIIYLGKLLRLQVPGVSLHAFCDVCDDAFDEHDEISDGDDGFCANGGTLLTCVDENSFLFFKFFKFFKFFQLVFFGGGGKGAGVGDEKGRWRLYYCSEKILLQSHWPSPDCYS